MVWNLVVHLILLLPLACGYNYCNNKTHICVLKNTKHFMCNLKMFRPFANRARFHASVPDNLKMQILILDKLNNLRNQFASGNLRTRNNKTFASAKRMRRLMWDKELAYMAHTHASTVSYTPTNCRSTLRFPYVGQVISLVLPPEMSDLEQISSTSFNKMFEEYLNVPDPEGLLKRYNSTRDRYITHFTTIISDRASRVGCGIVVATNCVDYYKFCYFFTCFFDFDNVEGMYVYKAGEPATSCDDWNVVSSDRYANLCKNNGAHFPHDQGDEPH
ncbi:antigen 5 like allergen Cul n 1-like [Drosophila eugracilis]|uniref:antigen 5 like allergen Cul n 1-like n=1 Tax=Drosophila eugracilis TaxID=29029 RepID=UPI0007E893E7|nr:antigen 5 like allergen Cul n 1-like [Drosophila eugracilis]